MKRLSCIEVEGEIWRYVDRELPAADLADISAHLDSCEACRAQYHESARESNEYRIAFGEIGLGADSADRIVAAMQRAELLPRGNLWTKRLVRNRAHRRFLALAAVVLITVTAGTLGYFWTGIPSIHLGGFEAIGGAVSVRNLPVEREPSVDDERFALAESGECWPGSVFRVDEGVDMSLRLKSSRRPTKDEVYVSGPTELSIDALSDREHLSFLLDRGSIDLHVWPRDPSESFEVSTPHALVQVVGTEFSVDVSSALTAVIVDRGEVVVRSRHGFDVVHVTRSTGEVLMGINGLLLGREPGAEDADSDGPRSSSLTVPGESREAGAEDPRSEAPTGANPESFPSLRSPSRTELDQPATAPPIDDDAE